MAENIVKVKIKQRYDTEANWKSKNPILLDGEMAISSDKDNQYKVGNGSSTWSQLSYAKAGPLDHSHNYAGSSSAGGAANTAVKWLSPRNINIAGDFAGTISALDGSADKTVDLYNYYSKISVGNTNNYPWHRIAKLDTIASSYQDRSATLLITQDFHGGCWGIAQIILRTNNSNSVSNATARWLVRCGFSEDFLQIGLYNVFGETYADVFLKTAGTYAGTVVRQLASGPRGTLQRTWTLINSTEVNNTTASDSLTSTECWASIENAATELHDQDYSTIISATDAATVKLANTATKATQDSSGQQINSTYIKNLSISNGNLTYTKGNGTTGNVALPSSASCAIKIVRWS